MATNKVGPIPKSNVIPLLLIAGVVLVIAAIAALVVANDKRPSKRFVAKYVAVR